MMVSKRGNAEQHVPVCSCFTSCGGFEYWIGGVWVNDRVVVLGTHTVTRSCWLGHCRSAGQASPCLMLISSIRFTSGFVIKTLVGLRWMPNDVHRALSGAAGPHFHCHNMCTMWIINQVLSLKVLSYYRLCMLSGSCLLVSSMSLLLALCPYVSMGIAAHWVNYRQVNNVWTDMYLIIIIVRHIRQFLSCVYQLESRVQYGVYPIFCRDIVLIGRSTMWTLWWFFKGLL